MNKRFGTALALASFACASLLLTVPASAQSVYGSIFGTVTDKTGAAIPGATIAVTDEAKGTVVTVISNASGDYTVSHLAPDIYDLKVSIKGFKSFETKGIQVEADTAPRIDPGLDVGGAETTVEVNADSQPQLKTDRADVAATFDSQQVNDLPIEGQNFANLQLLLPGAQLLGWSHAADENPQASRQIQIDGQAFGGVAYELDGTDNQDPILGIIVVNPQLDAITDAKITTQNFDAELGKAVAAVQTVQTKSGSNTFHGSAYDFRTGNANLARDPYSQVGPGSIPPGLKNKFGLTVGGPLSKDKRFFFFGYEGQRQKSGVTNVNTLPSKLLTETCLGHETGPSGIPGCDFSEYLANLPGGVDNGPVSAFPAGQIYDNRSGTPVAYTGNVIPAAQVSQQWVNLLTLLEPYTKAETGGDLGGLDSNSSGSGTGVFNSNMWVVRLDQTFSEKQTGFVRFTRWTDALGGPQMYGSAGGPGFGIGGYGGNSVSPDDSLAIGTDYVFSPKLIMDLRGGYLRYNIIDIKNDESVQEANALGMPGFNTAQAITSGSPGFFPSTLAGGHTQPLYGDGLGIARCNCPLTEREDQFQIVNNWTRVIGNHSVKVGADLRYGRNLRVPSDSDRTGVVSFDNNPTSDQLATASGDNQGGISFAAMALGDVTSLQRYVSSSTNAKEFQKREFFYAQDTWRTNTKLTLNLGVRWEGYFPESVNAPGNGALMNLSDGYLHVAGVGGIKSDMGWVLDKKKQFEPRLGATYQLTPKTVIRAGYGRSFDLGVFGSTFGHVVTQNLPVLANQSISASTTTGQAFCLGSSPQNSATPTSPGCSYAKDTTASVQPVGGGPLAYTPPVVPADGLLPNPGNLVNTKARPNPMQFPTLDAWNASVQHALTSSLTITAAYIGNKGTHTLSDGDGNNTNPNEAAINLPGSFSPTGQALHFDPTVNTDPTKGPVITASGATAIQNYLQRYYGGSLQACRDPNYTPTVDPNITLPAGACGWSQGVSYYGDNQNTDFNAVQITLAQATWHGLNINGNYQFAIAHDAASGYSTWDHDVVYGNDSAVRRQSATIYGLYQLPLGKGKQFLNGVNHAEDLLLGGYEVSATGNVASGLPFSLGLNSCGDDIPGSAPCQPNATGSLPTSLSKFVPGTGWTFYQAQTLGSTFTDPGLDNIGNVRRESYFGPHFYNVDLSLQKSFSVWEHVETKFRMDAVNAFNHINPNNPGGNIQSAGTITSEAPGPGPRQMEFSLSLKF
jgi:outer membrane receptor protein involved in Fe transport